MPEISTQTNDVLDEPPIFSELPLDEINKLTKTAKMLYYRRVRKQMKISAKNLAKIEKERKTKEKIEKKGKYMKNYMRNYNKMRYKYDIQYREKIKNYQLQKYYDKKEPLQKSLENIKNTPSINFRFNSVFPFV